MNDNLDDIALSAWGKGRGDALSAVKALRDATGLGLRDAAALIEKTAHQVGGRYNLRLLSAAEARALGITIPAIPEQSERLIKHRAARGVKKVRGQKSL